MSIDAQLSITDEYTQFQTEAWTITSYKNTMPPALEKDGLVYLFFKERHLIASGITPVSKENTKKKYDECTLISFENNEWNALFLQQIASDSAKEQPVIANTLTLLDRVGYSMTPKKGPKDRHKWTKEISTMPFYVDTRSSTATVYWQKRNEMRIEKGATMMAEAPLNKDGSVGFSAKMGDKIRSEHHDKVTDCVTTDDIILKSVNEVGLFLYYAGTNSWLELKNDQGQTIHKLTVVE